MPIPTTTCYVIHCTEAAQTTINLNKPNCLLFFYHSTGLSLSILVGFLSSIFSDIRSLHLDRANIFFIYLIIVHFIRFFFTF